MSLVLFAIPEGDGGLPGVALGSELILAVERAVALFAAWLLALVVIRRAIAGELPSEVSGRGVRYADAISQGVKSESRSALEGLEEEIIALQGKVAQIQRGGEDGHE